MLLRVGMLSCPPPPTQAALQAPGQPADLPQAGKERLYPERSPAHSRGSGELEPQFPHVYDRGNDGLYSQ